MSEAYQRFLESMRNFAVYHDGQSYDLDALRQLSGEELQLAEIHLIQISMQWPQAIEALDMIGSDLALNAIKFCLDSPAVDVKIAVARRLLARKLIQESDIEAMLVAMLRHSSPGTFSFIRGLAQEYPTRAVKRMLLWNVVYGDQYICSQAADLAYFLYGLSPSPVKSEEGCFRSGAPFRLMRLFGMGRIALVRLCHTVGEDTSWITPATPTSPALSGVGI